MLAESRIDHAHVEQDFGRIRNLVEGLERLVELIVVVEFEGLDPCLNFLLRARVSPFFKRSLKPSTLRSLPVLMTCFLKCCSREGCQSQAVLRPLES